MDEKSDRLTKKYLEFDVKDEVMCKLMLKI